MRVCPRICISATGGGAGKTMLSLGLGRAWRDQGLHVKPFKKGPDYIDAAWLAKACGQPASNLDLWFMSSEELLELFLTGMDNEPYAIALVEGNRGLYDGLNESGSCSTAQIARAINCPLLLCMDCSKTTRTIAAIINGLVNFEDGLCFAGVILNRIGSARHESSLRRAIETNTDLLVLGALPRSAVNILPERHMGLASFGSHLNKNIDQILNSLASIVQSNCDTDAILECARAAPPLPDKKQPGPEIISVKPAKRPVIGFARDEALWFYYRENLTALENAGADLREISLLNNDCSLDKLDGIYLGGGFPEDYCDRLCSSLCVHKLREFAMAGKPVYAECGGMIILCRGLKREGDLWPMAGVLNALVEWHARPRGLGYLEARVISENPFFPLGLTLRGHEFHYSSITFEYKPPDFALELQRGTGIYQNAGGVAYDGMFKNNVWGSYMHIFAPAVPCWAKNFVELAASRHGMP